MRLRSITHFNRFVKPRDRTRELIADHLATTLCAQPVRKVKPPTPPPSPSEIAEKRLTKIRRKIEEEWPDTEPVDDATVDHLGKVVKKAKANTEIEEYRMEVTPALARLGPRRGRGHARARRERAQRCRPSRARTTSRMKMMS